MKPDTRFIAELAFLAGMLLNFTIALTACTKEIERPEVTDPLMPDLGPEATEGTVSMDQISSSVAFNAGDGASVFRIPSIAVANDGTILVFAESRHESWRDKSYTDVVVKRSTDNGKTWSALENLTEQVNTGDFAFMDPTPVVDKSTGKIFLFCTRWAELDTDATKNRAFMITSSDNGKTWSRPEDVSEKVLAPGHFSAGFGPGHGIQISRGTYAGRLIVITRQYNGSVSKGYAVYSDDHGATWSCGSEVSAGESQIAEAGENKLLVNIRRGSDRHNSFSTNGGKNWAVSSIDVSLPTVEGGCEASVLNTGGEMVFYCGPESGPASSGYDNRYDLALYRSPYGGLNWTKSKIIYDKASGYSDMAILPDGRLLVVFEAGPERGFIRTMGDRPAGWMRIDALVIPKEITDYGYWFAE